MRDEDINRESAIHERINILKDQGYRGFTVTGGRSKWDGVEVSVKNPKGIELKAEGETIDEAFENIIELIDQALDDM